MIKPLQFVARIVLPCLLLSLISQSSWSNPRNFILILVDDQGWNGTSLQIDPLTPGSKSDFYETPNLEQLATQGVRFPQAYSPSPVCSPSRAAILTGISTAKLKLTGNLTRPKYMLGNIIAPTDSNNLPIAPTTIAEFLETQSGYNYQTAHYGKWHLQGGGPSAHGFDRGDGETTNVEGNDTANYPNDPKKTFTVTDSALAFIDSAHAAGDPFFLQVSYYAVHADIQAFTHTVNEYASKPVGSVHTHRDYAAMTANLDSALGLLTDKIYNTTGLDTNTYIIYFSDNGPFRGLNGFVSPADPLRGEKSYLYEGGIRVPLIIAGPGITGNTVNNTPVSGIDLFPTIFHWVRGSTNGLPADVEGGSLVNSINTAGISPVERKDTFLMFHFPHYFMNPAIGRFSKPSTAMIDEDNYKLMVDYETGTFELFNLTGDKNEVADLTKVLPARSLQMMIKMRDYLKSVNAQMPVLNPAHPPYTGIGNDLDNDGLDDDWEFRELLTAKFNGNHDIDKDGYTNEDEESMGTDPLVAEFSLLSLSEEEAAEQMVAAYNTPNELTPTVNFYPNPFVRNITVSINKEIDEPAIAELYDMNGIRMAGVEFSEPGEYFLGSDVPAGSYILRTIVNGQMNSSVVIKTQSGF